MFCSTKCMLSVAKFTEKQSKICKYCNNEFYTYNDSEFCCVECENRYVNKIHIRGSKKLHICESCGIEHKVYQNEINRGSGQFCSRKCAASYNASSNWFKVFKTCPSCGVVS